MLDSMPVLGAPSALARDLLEQLGLRRLPEWTVPRDVLERELAIRGWPCSGAVLHAEEAAGGLCLPGGVFGVHASLRYLRDDAPWQRDDLQDYDLVADSA